jgi:hypothetical protein
MPRVPTYIHLELFPLEPFAFAVADKASKPLPVWRGTGSSKPLPPAANPRTLGPSRQGCPSKTPDIYSMITCPYIHGCGVQMQ